MCDAYVKEAEAQSRREGEAKVCMYMEPQTLSSTPHCQGLSGNTVTRPLALFPNAPLLQLWSGGAFICLCLLGATSLGTREEPAECSSA